MPKIKVTFIVRVGQKGEVIERIYDCVTALEFACPAIEKYPDGLTKGTLIALEKHKDNRESVIGPKTPIHDGMVVIIEARSNSTKAA